MARPSISVVYVAYRTPELDLNWLPDGVEVVIVHNDDVLPDITDQRLSVINLRPGDNLGFGAGVNLAAQHATGDRLVVCNPDTALESSHFDALSGGTPDEIITIPLVDDDGTQTPVSNVYPSPISWLALALRVGRLAPLGSRRRRVVGQLTAFGRSQDQPNPAPASATRPPKRYPLTERWVSGAVFSIDRARFNEIDGFDRRFFLYYEDTDLCERFATRFPEAELIEASATPGVHAVGGSAVDLQSYVETIRRDSACEYASSKDGRGWSAARAIVRCAVR